MENLNAEQIKSELEGLAKFRTCPEYIKNALALINSQEQRIKELMSTSSLQGAIVGGLRTTANELTADKERLEKLLDDKCDRCIERERADTVRKMQERIKQYIDVGHYRSPTEICFSELDVANIIDRIAKEMLEGE